jgi:HEAT repeat protein
LNDPQSEIREHAARALGDIGDEEAVEPLIGALRALRSGRNDRPGELEFEFEGIAEALGRLNSPAGITAVIDSGTVCFREGVYSVSRPHVGGLCLSGGKEARAALAGILAKHYLYEPYSLVGVVEALDYLRERHITASLMEILSTCVESMRSAWQVSNNPFETSDRNVEALALAAGRALGRLDTKRAEPVLIDFLLRLPTHSFATQRVVAGSSRGGSNESDPPSARAHADVRHAILTLRGEKSPADFDCARSLLQLHTYQARRYKTDIVFGGEKRRQSPLEHFPRVRTSR